MYAERPLTPEESEMLRAIAPVTRPELAKLLGISTTRVEQIENRALAKILAVLALPEEISV